jgi:uncharacterized membrane-anchored protein
VAGLYWQGFYWQGYISDLKAKTLDFEDILSNIKTSELEGNKARARDGQPTIQTIGWVGTPFCRAPTRPCATARFSQSLAPAASFSMRMPWSWAVMAMSI